MHRSTCKQQPVAVLHWRQHRQRKVAPPVPTSPHVNVQGARRMKPNGKDPGPWNGSVRAQVPCVTTVANLSEKVVRLNVDNLKKGVNVDKAKKKRKRKRQTFSFFSPPTSREIPHPRVTLFFSQTGGLVVLKLLVSSVPAKPGRLMPVTDRRGLQAAGVYQVFPTRQVVYTLERYVRGKWACCGDRHIPGHPMPNIQMTSAFTERQAMKSLQERSLPRDAC